MNDAQPIVPLDPPGWLAAIIASSDDAIVSKTLDGIVTTWNKGAERIFGFTAEEMVGQPILKIIPEERHDEEPMILGRIRNGLRMDHFETVRRRKDGTLLDVSVTISPVRDREGRIVGVSKIARDITQQKRYERELSAARQAAEEAREAAESANRAKDQFLSILSHELRTPLTPALGAISFIEKDQTLPQELRDQMRMIRRNVETEARLVDDLLDLTRIARGKVTLHFEAVDAHALIRNVVAMFQKEIDEKGVALTLALRAREYQTWADPGRFQQILLNLLSNAVKFTPHEGSITVQTRSAEGRLQIEVSDTGIGIEPETLPRLFNAFEQGERTVTRRFGGLGLGLSIVKSLVEMHQGQVTARSGGRDQGASFTVSLPAMTAARGSNAETRSEGLAPSGYRILLVEDHADTRQVMTLLLRSFGCQVTQAGCVQEAKELAEREKFDLLVSDVGLPDGTGMDVMAFLKTRQPLPAIAMTGFGQEEDQRRTREAGFAVHLTKPIDVSMLQQAIRRAIS